MTVNEDFLPEPSEGPIGQFSYLDHSKLIKRFPDRNESYLIVNKEEVQYHLLAYDHNKDQMVLKDEIKGILSSFYPMYKCLLAETTKVNNQDFEKIALGVCIGMTVYDEFENSIIHLRNLHTYAFSKNDKFKGMRPLGDPDIPKDKFNLGFIFQTYPRNGANMYSYDGCIFTEEVMEILLYDYEIIEFNREPRVYKKLLSDVWMLKRKP
jgi:hypothetical protein